jgi:hypothetical protein
MAKSFSKSQPVVNPCCTNNTLKLFLLNPDGSTPVVPNVLLLEDGTDLLLENGTNILLE